jgi:hypothetical protein
VPAILNTSVAILGITDLKIIVLCPYINFERDKMNLSNKIAYRIFVGILGGVMGVFFGLMIFFFILIVTKQLGNSEWVESPIITTLVGAFSGGMASTLAFGVGRKQEDEHH